MCRPEFSLILPTRNRREVLRRVLEHLESLRYPRNRFEVVVVDDGSQDGTYQEVAARSTGYPLRIFRQPPRGAGAARNTGIREARGEFCLFVDDDVFPHPDLLNHHHEAHRGWFRRLVRGPVIDLSSLPLPQEPPPLWGHFSMNYLCTSNASLRRDLVIEAGLFDESLERWEDAELGVRLKALGVRRHFCFAALVYHLKPPVPLSRLLATAAADGRSAAALVRRYPTLPVRLRSGLHPLNYARSALCTAPPLRGMLERAARGEGGWFPPSTARRLLAEREYLRAGREALSR